MEKRMIKKAFLFSAGDYEETARFSKTKLDLPGVKYDMAAMKKRLKQIEFDVVSVENAKKKDAFDTLQSQMGNLPTDAITIKWIGTETDYQLLIELLENRITIREVLLHGKEEKLFVQYDGKQGWVEFLDKEQIPHELLPTTGEYMNAEDDEFLEEITYFKKKVS